MAQIKVSLGFPRLLEIVVQRRVEDRELDTDVVEILARGLDRVLPILPAAEDVGRVRSLANMIDEVADESDIDAARAFPSAIS